jgi:Na+/H+ antiporter NhaD/arsenite permease-like protein
LNTTTTAHRRAFHGQNHRNMLKSTRNHAIIQGETTINPKFLRYLAAAIMLGVATLLVLPDHTAAQQDAPPADLELSGFLIDRLNQPIVAAEVTAIADGEEVATIESKEDGSWVLVLEEQPRFTVSIEIERHHFATYKHDLSTEELARLFNNHSVTFGEIQLDSRKSVGFWIAGGAFLLALTLIALERLQNALAALTGISIVFASTFILGAFDDTFYIIDLERAITFINWEVIFLVMGMMIVVGILENTGIFQWLAFQAYRASRGRISWLIIVLVIITSIASALLDNVTTMLLMVPISMQIALALGISPLVLLIPEILASNISGISTLIGTPTNILIGAYAGITFNDFLLNQTFGVIIALIAMILSVLYFYRDQLKASGGGISETLYNKLKENATISDPKALKYSSAVFLGMLFFFIVGENIHMVPAVTALIGATVLLLLIEPDIHKMLRVVDWTTLVFFMALFMLVGAVQEVGILSLIAESMGDLIGDSMTLGIIFLVFGTGLLSFVVANVPLTAAMLPVVRFLSTGIPGASNNVLYYALSMGAAMGGNGFIISGETNLMTAGIAERAGYKISFKEYLRVGVPVTLITLAVGTGWLYLRFIVLGGD